MKNRQRLNTSVASSVQATRMLLLLLQFNAPIYSDHLVTTSGPQPQAQPSIEIFVYIAAFSERNPAEQEPQQAEAVNSVALVSNSTRSTVCYPG